jgi:hypothetical protein
MTGCGATTMLLENNQPMILSCPTRELCDNKSSAERHIGQILWYKKGVLDEDIREYLEKVDVPKFIVVYDSTSNLHKALVRIEDEDVSEKYVLAVDEAHMMMTALSYRETAIKSLTALLSKFDNVQFITATPVPVEFTPEVFQRYNYVEYQWLGAEDVNVIAIQQRSPIKAACDLIERFRIEGTVKVNNEKSELIEAKELIFFINSVKDIARIINTTELKLDECKIIVAERYHNIEILARALEITPKELQLAKASDPPQKYTFVTSKAFEGVDFYSESALSIVVSTVKSKSTLLDMGVSLPQIAGRIRTAENRLKGTLLFIYNTTSYAKSPDIQEDEVLSNINEAQRCIGIYNRQESDEDKRVLIKKYADDISHGFLATEQNNEDVEIKLDNDAIKLRRYQNYISGAFCSKLKVINTIEQTSNVTDQDEYFEENVILSYLSKQPFREVVENYIEAKETVEASCDNEKPEELKSKQELVAMLEKDIPLLPIAYKKLGSKKMQTASNRSEKSLKAAVAEFDKLDSLRGRMNDKFKVGEFYTNPEIIRLLGQDFYRKNINRNVKATDITFFYEVTSTRQSNPTTRKKNKGYLLNKSIRRHNGSMLTKLGITVP